MTKSTSPPAPCRGRINYPKPFRQAYGYDLLKTLPALIQGEDTYARQVRADYHALLAALYEQAFFKQIGDWCTQNGIQLTGHTEEDLLHHPRRQGDYFRTMRNLHIPGADCHDYRYRFPREISMHELKYAVSVARLYHKPRAMSEAMGGAGWGCSLQEYKRGINALGAAGINMFILHGFYNDCEHQGSQGDWPASFFFQNPYWKYFRQFAAYIHRISYMNTLGEAVVDVGLYYPIEEMAAHTIAGEPDTIASETDWQFHAVLRAFLESQIDIDIIDHHSLQYAQVQNGQLCAGTQKFRLLLFPSNLRRVDEIRETLQTLRSQGGMILFYPAGGNPLPGGFSPSDLCEPDDMPKRFCEQFSPSIAVLEGETAKLYCNHRIIDGQNAYMVASTLPKPRRLCLSLHGQGAVRKLNPEDGSATPLAAMQEADRLLVTLDLEADEACWLITGGEAEEVLPATTATQTIPLEGDWAFLPLDKRFDDTWAIDAEETVCSVPLAHFTDIRTGTTSDIRIRNMKDEAGQCRRHVSLWQGKWLGRRVGWGDDADKHDLYFVKQLSLESPVLSARVCIAAVNTFTLYINGRSIAHADHARTPQTLDITDSLQLGQNLIAVHVHTDTPLKSRELTQAETIPPDALCSLLLQGEIKTQAGSAMLLSDSTWAVAARVSPDWMLQEPQSVRAIDPKEVLCHVATGLLDEDWVWAWERGRPPMQPWGDLPLFGQLPQYPRPMRYVITLPAGTAQVHEPELTGTYTALLDGKTVNFSDHILRLPADGLIHALKLDVDVPSPSGGLHDNLRVHILPQTVSLGDFSKRGLPWFSGRVLYKKIIEIKKRPGCRYLLDLGRVRWYTEVWVNQTLCGTRIWEPYRVDITEQLIDGQNEIAVVVANAAACERRHMLVDEGMALAWNRYWNEDNIDREPEALTSGLPGPVGITVLDESISNCQPANPF